MFYNIKTITFIVRALFLLMSVFFATKAHPTRILTFSSIMEVFSPHLPQLFFTVICVVNLSGLDIENYEHSVKSFVDPIIA